MAGTSNDTIFINPSPDKSGFPPYLDFTTLRSNAINYLGPITGKYWTDYNVHDPGITTLEVLMYAIMDLGYRANLPIGSLLASGSGPAMVRGATATGTGTGACGVHMGGGGAGMVAGSAGMVAGAVVAGAASVAAGVGMAGAQDSNFFTPAQVFGCNPTSVPDYRKLLMDLDEVRNAWL